MPPRPATSAFVLARRYRLRRADEFRRLVRGGLRLSDARLQIWAAPGAPGATRLGLIVSRRHGGAVRRNRIKRLIREAFRHARGELPDGIDLAVAPVPGATLTRSAAEESLRSLVARLADRLAARRSGP